MNSVGVIPQNMEKYLSITVDRLKFIDSLQYTSLSLDSLVKILEVQIRAREAFPIAHEFELIKMTTWIASPDMMNLNCLLQPVV